MIRTPDPVLLAANENPLGPSPRAVEAMGRATAAAHRYPDAAGRALKEALAARLGVTPAHLALGNGSNELIELLVHAHVRPGDEVVYSRPSFVMYGVSVRLLGGVPVEVPGLALEHDLDAMRAAIGPRTRLVIVCNPNNPTGALVRAAEWRRFLAAVPAGVVVVSDEAYHEYVDDPAYPRTLDDLAGAVPLVVLRTFSKVYGLAGARVGYGIARPSLAAELERVRLPFNVNAAGQAGALAALDDHGHVERSRRVAREGKRFLGEALAKLGCTVHPSHTNFVLVDLGRPAGPLVAALADRGFVVRELETWGMGPSFVRITIGTAGENAGLVAALEDALGAARATGGAA